MSTESNRDEEGINDNEDSLRMLIRSIALSQGAFNLILVRCNSADLQAGIVERIVQQSENEGLKLQNLFLEPSVQSLHAAIAKKWNRSIRMP